MDVELRPFPNLVLKRGKEDLQAEGEDGGGGGGGLFGM